MSIKPLNNSDSTQKIFSVVPSIIQLSKNMIRKHPGIFKGNLIYWLMEKIPNSSRIDVELGLIQLLREGYFFSFEGSVYPPNKVNKNIKALTKFAGINNFTYTEYGILYELYRVGTFSRLSNFSRSVISSGWSENEHEVRIRIQELFRQHIIKRHDQSVIINWEYIWEVIG